MKNLSKGFLVEITLLILDLLIIWVIKLILQARLRHQFLSLFIGISAGIGFSNLVDKPKSFVIFILILLATGSLYKIFSLSQSSKNSFAFKKAGSGIDKKITKSMNFTNAFILFYTGFHLGFSVLWSTNL